MQMNAKVIAVKNFAEADERCGDIAPAIDENFYRDVSFVEVAENFFDGKFFFGRSRRNEHVDRAGNVEQKIFHFGCKFGIKHVNNRRDFLICDLHGKIERNFQREVVFKFEPNKIIETVRLHKKRVAAIFKARRVAQTIKNVIVDFGAIECAKIFKRTDKISADETPRRAIKIHWTFLKPLRAVKFFP